MKRGKLIVIEGTDSSGKKVKSRKLLERFVSEGIPCFDKVISFPRYQTPTGRIVGQCYLGKEDLGEGDIAWFGDADSVDPKVASLYYSADRRAALPKILDILNSGNHLILDRYVESNMAHQGGKAKTSGKREDIIKFLEELEYGLLELPRPDMTVFLHMPTDHAMKLHEGKGVKRDGHESNPDHLRRAEETFIYLSGKYEWITLSCVREGEVRSIDDIHEEVYREVMDSIHEKVYREVMDGFS